MLTSAPIPTRTFLGGIVQTILFWPSADKFANPVRGVGAEYLALPLLSELEIHVHAQRTKSELAALGNNQAATTLMQ